MSNAKNPQRGEVAAAEDLQAQLTTVAGAASDAWEQAKRADRKADAAHSLADEAKRQAIKATERTTNLKERIRIIGTELVSLGEDRDVRIDSVEDTARENSENILRMQGHADGRRDAEVTGQHMFVHLSAAEERAAREREAERLAKEREGNRSISMKMLLLLGTALTIISGAVTYLLTKLAGE